MELLLVSNLKKINYLCKAFKKKKNSLTVTFNFDATSFMTIMLVKCFLIYCQIKIVRHDLHLTTNRKGGKQNVCVSENWNKK